MQLLRSFGGALVAVAIAAAVSVATYAMVVQPVVIDLTTSGRAMSQVVTVENTFDKPLPVEMRVEGLDLTPDGVNATGKDPGDLSIFPPQTLIQPGQRQSFRVQYVGEPALARSKHYFLTAAQLPVQTNDTQSNVQLLYNFQILVSVSPDGVKPALSIASAEIGKDAEGNPAPVIAVANASAAHGYLSRGRVRVVQFAPDGKEIFRKEISGPELQQTLGYGLIGGGQTRRMTLPMRLPQPGGRIEALFTPDS
ncbi:MULTISPECIES: fimbria/pilus periplasmic chaperone [unclassified Sphingopyxis]|uniref:fimbria/pilus periplasmic chaperone n=1 Tax=unclassified Sphingopyxis TaxID=2614943 RepID=UPI0006C415FE|nr:MULTISPECIES: fimbria/pilus periplasmic chaperone [unclassified Sphingopyxis]USI75860.1 fimbria/pilus periplasmic chaperone [Sphingopyxis sp. USTB-05]GAO77601.1 p pilus assembly protein, chaperone PapD [Sphingopyxis sp. C-1]